MKKVINGKMYNTDTAKEIKSWINDNDLSWSDFGYLHETLYQKKTGEYFLHGCGGARTKYNHVCSDGSVSAGEKIIPLSDENAKIWLNEKYKEYMEYDEIKKRWYRY